MAGAGGAPAAAADQDMQHSFLNLAKARQWGVLFDVLKLQPGLVNVQPGGRWSALHQAVGAGAGEAIRQLLECRADPYAKTSCGKTALDLAPSQAVRDLLVGSRERERAEDGFLELAKAGRWDDMRKVLDERPDLVNVQPHGRWAALHQAAFCGNIGAVKMLLSRRADLNVKTAKGERPVNIALSHEVKAVLLAEEAARAAAAGGGRPAAAAGPAARGPMEVVVSSGEEDNAHPAASTSAASAAGPHGHGAGKPPSPLKRASVEEGRSPAKCARTDGEGSPAGGSGPTTPSTATIKMSGTFELTSWSGYPYAKGAYVFDPKTRRLKDNTDSLVGTFLDDPISPHPLSGLGVAHPSVPKEMPCVAVANSEIIAEIQNAANAGAVFVLPSQLNGAEYPHHTMVVTGVDEYKLDRTGGPRGQLAVHPAAAQFILDNAARDGQPGGINAIRDLLAELQEQLTTGSMLARGYASSIRLKNGYLELPDCEGESLQGEVLAALRDSLHRLRCLGMHDVQACGLPADVGAVRSTSHRVTLIYASAVPVQAYLNKGRVSAAFQEEFGRLILVGQYFGALRVAATLPPLPRRRKVFLMPLGGGVFNNRMEVIAGAISTAIEILAGKAGDLLSLLDIQVLAFKGKPSEGRELEALLRKFRKFGRPPPPLDPPGASPSGAPLPTAPAGSSAGAGPPPAAPERGAESVRDMRPPPPEEPDWRAAPSREPEAARAPDRAAPAPAPAWERVPARAASRSPARAPAPAAPVAPARGPSPPPDRESRAPSSAAAAERFPVEERAAARFPVEERAAALAPSPERGAAAAAAPDVAPLGAQSTSTAAGAMGRSTVQKGPLFAAFQRSLRPPAGGLDLDAETRGGRDGGRG